jgi:hypothetical protein
MKGHLLTYSPEESQKLGMGYDEEYEKKCSSLAENVVVK